MLRSHVFALFIGLILVASASAESPERFAEQTPAESLFKPVGLSRELGVPEPPPPIKADGSVIPQTPTGVELLPKFDVTHLPRHGNLGVTDIEAAAEIRLPFANNLPPLKIIPGLGAHFWSGPLTDTGPAFLRPDMPGATYDMYADIKWRPRPFEWLFVDLRVTPGWYTDGDNWADAFRLRGHALAMICFSEHWQVVAGLVYTNRVRTTVVPAGGIRWVPDDETEFRLVFPAPRIARQIGIIAGHKVRAYLSGEFGGSSWAIRRSTDTDDQVEYSDLRAILGVEAEGPTGRTWHIETGYVFDRRLDYASNLPPSAPLGNTLLFRVGMAY
jgi:hypothetical protein